MEEVQYLQQGAFLVTSTRIEIAGQTFAVRNVGSVKVTKPGLPWLAILVGVFALLSGLASRGEAWFAFVIAAACAVWAWQQMRLRKLVLVSGGGEVVALKSTDGSAVEGLRSAIAQAISAR